MTKQASNAPKREGNKAVPIARAVVFLLLLLAPGLSYIGAASSDENRGFLLSRIPERPTQPDPNKPGEKPSKGTFLVASQNMRDPRFAETVILLVQYDRTGALGLIINKPIHVKLAAVFPEIKGLKERKDSLYVGGPVATNEMRLLIRSGSQPEESGHVFGDIYVSSSRAILERMVDRSDAGERFRVYAGYAGWGPGQLDRELLRGGWHVVPADGETIFEQAPSEIWPELIRRSSTLQVRVQESTSAAVLESALSKQLSSQETGMS